MQVKSITSVLLYLIWLQLFLGVESVSNPLWIINANNAFCYDPNELCGPPLWAGTCRTGQRQSPIDIHVPNVNIYKRWTSFTFNQAYATTQPSFFAADNGHSFQVQFESGLNPSSALSFEDAALNPGYRFAQLHFHWGSEHTFNGIRYPLELHIVHYNAYKYASFTDAVNSVDDAEALAVFAVFFKVGDANPAMDSIVDVARMSEMQDDYMRYAKTINVHDLLPGKLNFVRYSGSLTTPPCTENVIWTVFSNPVTMSQQQLEAFYAVRNGDDKLFMNFRPTQPLNGRRVETFGVPGLRRTFNFVQQEGLLQNSPILKRLVQIIGNVFQYLMMQTMENVAMLGHAINNVLRVISSSSFYQISLKDIL